MFVRITLFLLCFTCLLQIRASDGLKRGLYFQSFEVDKDKRTCLDLTPGKPLDLSSGFTMEFDLHLRWEVHGFGYVFRIICNDSLNIDLLSDITSSETNYSLVAQHQVLIKYRNPEINFDAGKWVKVSVHCDPSKNEIAISLNGVEKTAQYPMDPMKRVRIYFGGNTHDIFSTTDIVPMTVKDIRIFDESMHLIRHWELEKHADDCVYDRLASAMATVSNPQWEVDSHIRWNKRVSFALPQSQSHYYVAFDPAGDRIFVTKDGAILVYGIKSRKIDTVKVHRGVPLNTEFNQLEYDPVEDELISYDFVSGRLVKFNFRLSEWNNEDNTVIPPHYGHHSNRYFAGRRLLVTFGGYGFHQYHSVLYRIDTDSSVWENYRLSTAISPRYLGSMGRWSNSELLYFGGFGNESGKQEEFPRNYYDLYTINIDSRQVKKIWELSGISEQFTNSNSLIVDKPGGKFYALAYPNKRYASVITLHEYMLDRPEYRTVGDSIPYFFNDVDSYCDLFQSSDSSELYAVTSHADNGHVEISLYSIAYPPLSPTEIFQNPPSRTHARWWLLSALLPAGVLLWVVYRKRTVSGFMPDKHSTVGYSSLPDEKKPSSISLIGNFHIFDSEGNDIVKILTPTTTQLFLLILMQTIKNGQGITSQELRKALWFDKDELSARNNRNVYIAKLRTILKPFGDIKILNSREYWSAQYEKNIYCDYEHVLMLIRMLQADHPDRRVLSELLKIAMKGTLLPDIQQAEWLEQYQTEYANLLIESLLEYGKRDEIKADLGLLLKIADVILLHDNIDEDAIRLKCYALFHTGRKNQALQTFGKFTADYESLLATRHNLIFDEVVKSLSLEQ
ncbi:MAG: hypothetical protein LBL04_12270 [Bacteroidales bacterium]|nr:hypothetical protein [Bacteroidales bacterium]